MLICKGREVNFFVGEREMKFSAPKSYGMLHDPSGESWPSDSILVAPFSKDGKEIEDSAAASYFGDDPVGGSVSLPPKDLSKWPEIGPVEKIEYTRLRPHGMPMRYEGLYYHCFDGSEGLMSLLTFLFKDIKPVLYRRGRLYRMELPAWADLRDEGYVWP